MAELKSKTFNTFSSFWELFEEFSFFSSQHSQRVELGDDDKPNFLIKGRAHRQTSLVRRPVETGNGLISELRILKLDNLSDDADLLSVVVAFRASVGGILVLPEAEVPAAAEGDEDVSILRQKSSSPDRRLFVFLTQAGKSLFGVLRSKVPRESRRNFINKNQKSELIYVEQKLIWTSVGTNLIHLLFCWMK